MSKQISWATQLRTVAFSDSGSDEIVTVGGQGTCHFFFLNRRLYPIMPRCFISDFSRGIVWVLGRRVNIESVNADGVQEKCPSVHIKCSGQVGGEKGA